MNTTVTSRRAASKSGSSSSADVLLSLNTMPSLPRKAKNKGKKPNNLLLVVVGFFLLSWVGVLVFSGGSASTNAKLSDNPNVRATRQLDFDLKKKVIKKAIVSNKSNPYEGWQPAIHSDNNDGECKSWRVCFKGRKDSESCLERCRESPEALGEAPPRPGFIPDPHGDSEDNNEKAQAVEWIPDVTVLHRMLKAGKDENGNPWPPPLVTEEDQELCEDIGNFGGEFDDNKKALDAINIRGMDMLGTGIDWSTKKMKRAPRILCMVYTMEQNHHTNIRAIRETWGPGCDGFLAFSTRDDPRLPAISLAHEGPEAYQNMWQKVRSIWRFVGQHYLEDFDFFFQGGEDLYVLPQNLRNYLSDAIEDPTKEEFFGGRRFRQGATSKIFFNSGGAGYALSQATLRKFFETGLDHPDCFTTKRSAMEDVFIARCLKVVFDIGLADTQDSQGRERFHPFSPAGHYTWEPPGPGQRDWYEAYSRHWGGPKLKEECCAPDSVSFHYMKKPATVRHIHALLYSCDQFKK